MADISMTMNELTYVTNKELLVEIEKSKTNGKVTEALGDMIVWIAYRYGKRSNFISFVYVDEMIGEAIMKMIESYVKFDPTKGNTPFAYLHAIAVRAFIDYIDKQQGKKSPEKYEES